MKLVDDGSEIGGCGQDGVRCRGREVHLPVFRGVEQLQGMHAVEGRHQEAEKVPWSGALPDVKRHLRPCDVRAATDTRRSGDVAVAQFLAALRDEDEFVVRGLRAPPR